MSFDAESEEKKKRTVIERQKKRNAKLTLDKKKTREKKKKKPWGKKTTSAGNDQDEYGFERGSTKSYSLRVRHPIGKLKRVRVAQVEPSACDLGTAWFLEKVCVLPPSSSSSASSSAVVADDEKDSSSSDGAAAAAASKKIEFPCSGWLGSDESAENFLSSASVMERELAPAGSG